MRPLRGQGTAASIISVRCSRLVTSV
jgi:hypothetical protein